jgi:hypothetical protein
MRRIIIFSYLFIAVSNLHGQAPTKVQNWPYKTRHGQWAIDNIPAIHMKNTIDSSMIFFGTAATFELDNFHFDKSFFAGWPLYFDTLLFGSTPILADIDHDDEIEIIITGSKRDGNNHYVHSELHIYNADGSSYGNFPQVYSKIAPPNLADFDNDGEYELIFFDIVDDLIYCVNMQGDMEPGWPIPRPQWAAGSIGGGGSVGDLDLDGYLEYLLKGEQDIYAFRYDGTTQPGFPIHIFDDDWYFQPVFGPNLADIDQDGYLEILITGDNNTPGNLSGFAAIYEHTGDIKTGWPYFIYGRFPWNSPTIGDIDNNGTLEFGFTAWIFIYFLDGDGYDLPGWPVSFIDPEGYPSRAYSDIIMVDIDGDRDCEIFWDNNRLYYDSIGHDSTIYWGYSYMLGVDHYGQPLTGFPLELEGVIHSRPPTFAYDSASHRMYMSVHSAAAISPYDLVDTSYVELYVFPDSTGPPDQWPMQSHDNLHTKNYNFVDNVTSNVNDTEVLPRNYVLKQNYPNPFNSVTTIEFALPEAGEVSLAIYDILGREVARPVSGYHEAGWHRVTVDMDNEGSGVYFYNLTSDKLIIKRKMILLK